MLPNILKAMGLVVAMVSVLHLTLGPQADVLLGAGISESSIGDATLDSQNRFYGVAFLLYGVIMIYCASDICRYKEILLITFGVFFAAGLARVVSILLVGWPTWPIVMLLGAELLIPPIFFVWIRKSEQDASQKSDA